MDKELRWLIFLCVVVFGSALLFGWYQAGIQAEVYKRQGVKMSTWEVFCGAKPVERPIKEAVSN